MKKAFWLIVAFGVASACAGAVLDGALDAQDKCEAVCEEAGYVHGQVCGRCKVFGAWREPEWCSCWTTETGLVEAEVND